MSAIPRHPSPLSLGFGQTFAGLYDRESLRGLDAAFLSFLGEVDATLRDRLATAREAPERLAAKDESDLLVALAPHLEDFLARLFGIEAEVQDLAARHHELAPLYSVKRLFVQRRALHRIKADDVQDFDGAAVERELAARFGEPFSEPAFARHVTEWQKDETVNADGLELAARYAAWAVVTPRGKARHRAGVLFKAPRKLDFMRLVPVHTDASQGFPRHTLPPEELRRREGFALTDRGTDLVGARGAAEANDQHGVARNPLAHGRTISGSSRGPHRPAL